MSTPAERAQRTVDATFRDQGVAASYAAPGAFTFTLCTAIRRVPDLEPGAGTIGRPIVQGDIVELMKREIAAPAKGGTVEIIDGSTLEILSDPFHAENDTERLVWLMMVAEL